MATVAQRASRSCVNLRQQRASLTPPGVSTNRSERKPDHVGPGGLKHTDDIFLCRVGIVGVHVLHHIGLRSKSLAGGPWLSLLPYLDKTGTSSRRPSKIPQSQTTVFVGQWME